MTDDRQVICKASGCAYGADCTYWHAAPAATHVVYVHPQHTGEHCVHFEQRPHRWGDGAETYEDD